MQVDEFPDEIIPGLFLGSIECNRYFPGIVVCVHEAENLDLRSDTIRIPILAQRLDHSLVAAKIRLDKIAMEIDLALEKNQTILIHCIVELNVLHSLLLGSFIQREDSV